LLGVLFGGVAEGVGDLMRDDPKIQEMFQRLGGSAGLIDSFLAGVMTIVGLIASAYAVQATLRLRAEETSGRAEPVLATFGLFPRLSPVAWAGPAVCFLIGVVGAGGQLDDWVRDISPFSHLPQLPGGSTSAGPLITLIAIAAVLALVGLVGLRRRDMPVG
jgi:ABC-2 type transport system permease protein